MKESGSISREDRVRGHRIIWGPRALRGKVVQINSRFADPAIETDKHELSLGRCPGPTRTFIVHIIWRLTRILERGPIPQNGNVVVLSRSSIPNPEQYDGNRHIRMEWFVSPPAWAPNLDF